MSTLSFTANTDMTRKQSFLKALVIVTVCSVVCIVYNINGALLQPETSLSMIPLMVPANIKCTQATVLQLGDTIEGTTPGVTLDTLPPCFQMDSQNNTAGIWYTFQGDGSVILVSTCPRAYNGSNTASTDISLFEGLPGGQQEFHVNYLDRQFPCGEEYSSRFLSSTRNATYYVKVSNSFGSTISGLFFLTVSAYTKPIHGRCSNAGVITVDGDPVHGTISTTEDTKTPCGSDMYQEWFAYGVAWYRIDVRKNATLRASTRLGSLSFGTDRLTVVHGECGAEECLVEASFDSWATFDVVADGSNYFIVVSAYDGAIFELGIHTFNPPDNDDCQKAIRLIVDGPSVIGTLFDSTSSSNNYLEDQFELSCGGREGVWYSFTGNGDTVIASSCSDVYSPSISIFEGECGILLKCLGRPLSVDVKEGCYSNSGYSAVQTIKGVTYHIYVSSSTRIKGSFILSVETVTTSPSNVDISGAIEVFPDNDLVVTGNTVGVLYDASHNQLWTANDCDPNTLRSPALWYLVRGTGKAMTAHVNSRYSKSQFVVCIAHDPHNEDLLLGWEMRSSAIGETSAIWQTEPGVDYYLRVASMWGDIVGEFGLRVSSFERAVNDDCTGAIELKAGVTVSASMDGAFPGDPSDCVIDTNEFEMTGFFTPGLWYYVDGLGSALEISTCDPLSGDPTFYGLFQVLRVSSSGLFHFFKGSSCSSTLSCVPITLGSCLSSYQASVRFLAEEGERYYLLFLNNWAWDENNNYTITATYLDAVEIDDRKGIPVERTDS